MAIIDSTPTSPNSTTVVKLSKPILTHKGTIDQIELREPTAKSYIRATADPFTVRVVDGGTQLTYNIPATIAFLSDITGLDQIVLESLAARDFLALRDKMAYLAMVGSGDARDPSAA